MANKNNEIGDGGFDVANSPPETRLGHRERLYLDSLLNRSVEDGYLELDEYEKRLENVFDAKTLGAAERELADLPLYQQAVAGGQVSHGTPAWIKWVWFGLSIPMATTTSIWMAVFLLTGEHQNMWPIWVLIPLLIAGGALTIAERSIIRPWWQEEQRKRRMRRVRKRFDD
ncbi:DUF1707 SHOCT-like domain-containing protein [Haloglycomyces albus]|uniref:DUF1707 SHOCT-like domain-containing protein n=1 Tax=Haloglycomyces albus TaxID=526067 RepID=UPI00046C9022|nr:DUF1707 domain-containing protein [Haloglycomyces albus]